MRGLLSRLSASDGARRLDEVESIIENLKALLNARLGNAPSAEGYGMVDFSDLVHGFPAAAPHLQRQIRETISIYEPRLKGVRVRLLPGEDPLVLTMEVSARLVRTDHRGTLRLRTEVLPGGLVRFS